VDAFGARHRGEHVPVVVGGTGASEHEARHQRSDDALVQPRCVAEAQLGANLHEPRDADTDRGAHGAFDDQAHDRDVVSLLSRTVGRTVGVAVGGALLTVGKLLDALP
jgi:hypothetical protein